MLPTLGSSSFQLHWLRFLRKSTKQRNVGTVRYSCSGLIAVKQSVQLDALMRDKAGQVLDPKLSRAAAQVAAQPLPSFAVRSQFPCNTLMLLTL